MKEFAYAISLMNDGKMSNFEVKIEEEKVKDFLCNIAMYKDLEYKGYIKITLIYIQDMSTFEKDYVYTDIVNELKNKRARKQALSRLNNKIIDYKAVLNYLNYSHAKVANILYKRHDDYNFILDSSFIEYISDIDITIFERENHILTFYNSDLNVVCKIRMIEKD